MSLAPIRAALVVSLLALPGCSAVSALGGAGKPLGAFELRAAGKVPEARRTLSRDLVIVLPTTGGSLATDRILVRPTTLQAEYLPEARWTENTPDMVQTMLLRAFENTNGLRFVGRRPLDAYGDYALLSEVTDFQVEPSLDGKSGTVRLRMIARLVREDESSILGTRTFQVTADAATLETLDVVNAFNAASEDLMADLTGWVLGRLGL